MSCAIIKPEHSTIAEALTRTLHVVQGGFDPNKTTPWDTVHEIKKLLSLELRNPVASPGVAQIKKNSTVSERSRHFGKDALG